MSDGISFRERMEVFVDDEVRKKSTLGRIIISLRKTGITRKARYLMLSLQYSKDCKHPTEKMKETKRYFKEHANEIKENLSCLFDAESKDVYLKMIKFRYTHNLRAFPKYNLDNSYFLSGIVPKKNDGVFIDCGAYTGDSAGAYIDYNGGQYKSIVCFEPDDKNYEALKNNFISERNISVIKKGVWNENTTLRFNSGEGSASNISRDSTEDNKSDVVEIEVCSIDETPECSDATFIKMDIEGAEYEALCGAEKTIRKNRPILAICIYHSDEDMIRLIKWIKALDLNYAFHVRQHSFDEHDTVLYAIPQ